MSAETNLCAATERAEELGMIIDDLLDLSKRARDSLLTTVASTIDTAVREARDVLDDVREDVERYQGEAQREREEEDRQLMIGYKEDL